MFFPFFGFMVLFIRYVFLVQISPLREHLLTVASPYVFGEILPFFGYLVRHIHFEVKKHPYIKRDYNLIINFPF